MSTTRPSNMQQLVKLTPCGFFAVAITLTEDTRGDGKIPLESVQNLITLLRSTADWVELCFMQDEVALRALANMTARPA